MSRIEEFHNWAKQFIAIQDSHMREFLDSIGDLSLHELKRLFSEKYQDNIAFSYVFQIEKATLLPSVHDGYDEQKLGNIKQYNEGSGIGFGEYGNFNLYEQSCGVLDVWSYPKEYGYHEFMSGAGYGAGKNEKFAYGCSDENGSGDCFESFHYFDNYFKELWGEPPF